MFALRNHALAGLLILVTTFSPAVAWAWGNEGHETVAAIAAVRLTPAAAAEVIALLEDEPLPAMVAASTWADRVRSFRPETSPWHFVDIPLGSGGYDAARDCRNHDCVVDQITLAVQRVSNRALLAPVRAEALKFLIHFVGDVHQPLHAADNGDRGGNGVFVVLGGRVLKLHHVWDTEVVDALSTDRANLADIIGPGISQADLTTWAAGTPADWANESFALAGSLIYTKLGITGPNTRGTPLIVPASYLDDVGPIVETQLRKAGVRLAWLLNGAFR